MKKIVAIGKNSENVSFRIPKFLKDDIEEISNKYNIPISKVMRLFLYYSTIEKDNVFDFYRKIMIEQIDECFENNNILELDGFNIEYDDYDIVQDDIEIKLNVYKNNELFMTKKFYPMDTELKF